MNAPYNTISSALNKSLIIATVAFILVVLYIAQLLMGSPWIGLQLQTTPENRGLIVKAVKHPELSGHIKAGERIDAIKSGKLPYMLLDNRALVDDPDNYPVLQEYNAALQYNAALYARLTAAPEITVKTGTGREISFKPLASRSLFSLSPNFWISNFTAFVGLLFAAAIWAYRRQDLTTRLLFACGLFFAIASTVSAIYGSRGLAMNPDWYAFLIAINHLAMPMVAYSLLALVLIYPHRLVPFPVVVICLLIPVVLWLNTLAQWTDLPFHTFYLGMMLAFLGGIPPSIQQWRLSKHKPLERAALMWMLLSIYIASGCEIFLYLVPTIFGHAPALPLWAAQLIFLPLYIGFIMGVFRYRLFDVERWWLLSWHWVLSGLLIIGIDLLLVSVLHLQALGALSVAMILVAWLYFPLRQWLWRHLGQTPEAHLENHIHDFIKIFLGAKQQDDFKQHWLTLLQQVFSASSVEIAGGVIASPKIGEQGMNLLIPGINGDYHIDLYGKHHSSRLFSKQDITLAATLNELATHTKTLQQAKEQGANLERNRIMRDLHDDVGANLVSMIYRAHDKAETELARETLTLLRETIYTLDDKAVTRLSLAIAKWRQETQQRCLAADVCLEWEVGQIPSLHELDARQLVNLGRVLRETLTNALKHAQPKHFSARFWEQAGKLHILLAHDGNVTSPQKWIEGKGIPGMRTRIHELHGEIDWALTDRLETRLSVPLHRKTGDENHA